MLIHSTSQLPINLQGQKKVLYCTVGEETLSFEDDKLLSAKLTPITHISTEPYSNWLKLQIEDGPEIIVDADSKVLLWDLTCKPVKDLENIDRVLSVSGEYLYIKNKKSLGRESQAFKLDTAQDYIILEDMVFLNKENNNEAIDA